MTPKHEVKYTDPGGNSGFSSTLAVIVSLVLGVAVATITHSDAAGAYVGVIALFGAAGAYELRKHRKR